MKFIRCLDSSKVSASPGQNDLQIVDYYFEQLLAATLPESYRTSPCSSVRDCLFSSLASQPLQVASTIRSLSMRHFVVRATHLKLCRNKADT